jgi:DNA-binding MarR family transcriptional regulator
MKKSKNSSLIKESPIPEEAKRLADFVIYTQRSCILNLSPELNGNKISYPQFFLLTYLDNEDYLTMSSIARKMGHSTAAATGMVDKLQEMHYIERTQAANDRRKIMVKITKAGKELVAKMRSSIARDLASLLQKQDEEMIRHLPQSQSHRRGIRPFHGSMGL